MGLILVGLNHESAPLPVREKVAYSPEEAVLALKNLKDDHHVPQAFLLSTCNRTELYAIVGDSEDAVTRLKKAVFDPRYGNQNGPGTDVLYEREGAEAVRHLFRVACGLDSMVLGEQEILGQVKTAFEISRNAETVGTIFHRLANQAFRVGKRARTKTKIGYGAISIAYAAVELAEKVYQSLDGRGALLVGAGENGTLCAEHLLSKNVSPLLISNRTVERAEILAQKLGGETVPMDNIPEAMTRVDVVVATTGSPEPIIDEAMVRTVMHRREGRALVFIDIAVPRDVEPDVEQIPNAFRFDLDALNTIVRQSIARRQKEVPAVEQLVETEVAGFMRWWESLASGPVIRDLHRAFEAVRETEYGKNVKRFRTEDQEQLDVFSRNLVRKILSGPTMEIKHYGAGDPIAMERLAAIRQVFGLDERVDADNDDDTG